MNLDQLLDLENKKLGYKMINKLLPIEIQEVLSKDSIKNQAVYHIHMGDSRNKNVE